MLVSLVFASLGSNEDRPIVIMGRCRKKMILAASIILSSDFSDEIAAETQDLCGFILNFQNSASSISEQHQQNNGSLNMV